MSTRALDEKIVAAKAVKKIVKDLCDRSGLQNAWEEIDSDTQAEIIKTWTWFVERAIEETK